MHILVLTSCTGEKSVEHARALTLDDFRLGDEHVRRREQELGALLTPAEVLYTGQQHLRLMRGVQAVRAIGDAITLELRIVSAGHGLVEGCRPLAPYEATFQGMPRAEARHWGAELGLPAAVRAALAAPYDLALVLLGDAYLAACALDNDLVPGGPTLVLCGTGAARRLPTIPGLRPLVLGKEDTRRFGAGLVALKGEVAGRLLSRLAAAPETLAELLDPAADILTLLAGTSPRPSRSTTAIVPNPKAERVAEIPAEWWEQSRARALRYFIPDWDDRVDPDYDFIADRHAGGRGDRSNEVYAHQLYPAPNYDGLLVSRVVAEQSCAKIAAIRAAGGIHPFLRVPDRFPVMGDCGAFGYILHDTPPYTTPDILDYYTELGFDLGVSVDHLILAATDGQRGARYELTIQNADDFITAHRVRGLRWQPVGAVQGWDADSYADAARRYVAMGYRYIALGGMVRTRTEEILRIVSAVREVVPRAVKIHLFGIGRLAATADLVALGVDSVDSASGLRRAWLRSNQNLLTTQGWYSAIRIPEAATSPRARALVDRGVATFDDLTQLEHTCLRGLRAYAAGPCPPSTELVDRLVEYDQALFGPRRGTSDRLRRTLEDRPWEMCGCTVCDAAGVEVAIFRGNNRNRRRGFHNTHVFYDLMRRLLAGETIPWLDRPASPQLALFAH